MPDAILVFCATLGYGALHSLLASLPVKAAVRRVFGPWADHFYRLTFNFIAGISLIPLLALVAWKAGPILVIVPWPGAAILIGVQVVALGIMLLALRNSEPAFFLGIGQLGTVTSSGGLVTTGAYGVVRHPLYTTGLLILWCFPVLTVGTLAFDAGITLYVLIGSELEERRLIVEFGDVYLRYRKKIARLIPFIF